MSAENTVAIVQLANTLIATLCSLAIHGYIIYRIRSRYTVLTHYQNLLLAQSSLYIIGSILRLLVNRAATLEEEEKRGYPFLPLTPTADFILIFALDLVEPGESIMLAIFNVHRVLLFVRPSLIKYFYSVGIPIAIAYVVYYAYIENFRSDYTPYFLIGFFLFISCTILVCYIILRRHFALNPCSERVRKLQNKLSNGIIVMILIHISAIGLLGLRRVVIFVYALLFGASDYSKHRVSGIYIVGVYLVFIWYPVATGLIIRWSVAGFLTKKRGAPPKFTMEVISRTSNSYFKSAREAGNSQETTSYVKF